VVVVGDVILDEYLFGRTERLSREAPIPVLEHERTETIPGGAANLSANVSALGGKVTQIGVVGSDPNGVKLKQLLLARGIDPTGIVIDADRPTTTKTRILAAMGLRFPQQLARIDKIDRAPISEAVERAVCEQITKRAQEDTGAFVASDYLTGLLTPRVVGTIRDVCAARGILATADAQGNLSHYAGFDMVKCNADEAMRYVGRKLTTSDDYAHSGREMVAALKLRGGMLITRGSEGITIVQASGQKSDAVVHVPAPHIEDVYDTVGAGDTVLAVMTLALLAGASYEQAAQLSNIAAGIVIRKVGNYTPTSDELRAALDNTL
jgi:D-glycero-beta-D-manno-heptose-7-phosphate kinase